MAKLDPRPHPGDWAYTKHLDPHVDHYIDRTNKLLDAIPVTHLVTFPVADGRAMYFVKSWDPLTLQHIPFGDAYQIPAAHMRGLTEADVRENIAAAARLRSMYGRAKQ